MPQTNKTKGLAKRRHEREEDNASKVNLLAEDSMRNDDYLAPMRTGKKRPTAPGKFGDTKDSLRGLLRK